MSQEASQPSSGYYEWNGHGLGHTRRDFEGTFDQFVDGRQTISMSTLIITVLENYEEGMSENFLLHSGFRFQVRNPPTGGLSQPIFEITKEGRKIWISNEQDMQKWDLDFRHNSWTWTPEAFTGPGGYKLESPTENQVADFAKSVLKDHVWTRSPGKEITCSWGDYVNGWTSSHFGLESQGF